MQIYQPARILRDGKSSAAATQRCFFAKKEKKRPSQQKLKIIRRRRLCGAAERIAPPPPARSDSIWPRRDASLLSSCDGYLRREPWIFSPVKHNGKSILHSALWGGRKAEGGGAAHRRMTRQIEVENQTDVFSNYIWGVNI